MLHRGTWVEKILLESIWEEATLALMLVKISDWLFPHRNYPRGLGRDREGQHCKVGKPVCCLGELCSPFGYCNSAAEGEERAVQLLSGLLVPFVFRRLMCEW